MTVVVPTAVPSEPLVLPMKPLFWLRDMLSVLWPISAELLIIMAALILAGAGYLGTCFMALI